MRASGKSSQQNSQQIVVDTQDLNVEMEQMDCEEVMIEDSPQRAEQRLKYGNLIDFYPVELIKAYWDTFNIKDIFEWQRECLMNPKVSKNCKF